MTSKEALEILVKQANERKLSNKIVANGIAVSLLEKLVERDTPKKPTPQFPNTTFIYWCPKCDCSSIQRYDKNCHNCGQRLDWS